jgi:hypothetical protein
MMIALPRAVAEHTNYTVRRSKLVEFAHNMWAYETEFNSVTASIWETTMDHIPYND